MENPENFPKIPRYLYFGCRNFEKDYIYRLLCFLFLSFLYRDELESYVREGILTELIACESQGTSGRPKYVQDALQERAEEVYFIDNISQS